MTARAVTGVTTVVPAFQPSPLALQRQCACGNHASGGECDSCAKEKKLQRHAAGGSGPAAVPAIVNDVLRSPGRPLEGATRGFMEPLFGHDFAQVRVHTDAQAARSASAVNAHAYTVGRDVVFASGRYAPDTHAGRRLLAHELTHTLQQRNAPAATSALSIGHPLDAGEREADRVADAVLSGEAVATSVMPAAGLQRQEDRGAAPGEVSETAVDSGPGPYHGCGPYRERAQRARADATRLAERATTLLDDQHVAQAGPLLQQHFHLDATAPENQPSLQLIRDQFARMQRALSSSIRILCRRPAVGLTGGEQSPLPTDTGCCSAPPVGASQICGPGGAGFVNAHSASCAAGNAGSTVTLCEAGLEELSGHPLVKTVLHEFAHIACNGSPPIRSGGLSGGEAYYEGDRLPGGATNDLVNADSYAWFAMQAERVIGPAAPAAGQAASGEDHTGFGVLTGLGAVATIAGAIGLGFGIATGNDYGIGFGIGGLVAGGLGLGFGIAGVTGAFDRRRQQARQSQQRAAPQAVAETASPRSLSDLQRMSAWELAQLPQAALAAVTGTPEGTGPRLEDYARAWQLVRCIRDFRRLTVDPTTAGQLGRDPTATEWPVLRQTLEQILAHENVGALVRGPGGRGDLGTPPMAGRVRVVDALDWGIKRYQLERLVSSIGAGAEAEVRAWWAEARCAITPGSSPRIVDQERQMAVFSHEVQFAGLGIGGFYFPPDDTVYLNEALMERLSGAGGTPEERADAPVLAGHEMVHLVGGRDDTRQAFVSYFGGDTWICYWSAFEEGMAEITTRDALMSGRSTADRGYLQNVELMREIMTTLGAERVRRAYFTGTPDRAIFEELRRSLPSHMDPTLPPVCGRLGAQQP